MGEWQEYLTTGYFYLGMPLFGMFKSFKTLSSNTVVYLVQRIIRNRLTNFACYFHEQQLLVFQHLGKLAFIMYARFSEKIIFSDILIRKCMCSYQEVRTVRFSKYFAFALN